MVFSVEDLPKEEDFNCVGYMHFIEEHGPLSLEAEDLNVGVRLILLEGVYVLTTSNMMVTYFSILN